MFGYQDQEVIYLPDSSNPSASYQQNNASAAETLNSIAAITRAITQPAAEAYKAHLSTDVERERIRAGLPPTVVVAPRQTQPQTTISPLAIGVVLVVLYLLFK